MSTKSILAFVLVFEAIIVWLAIPVAVAVYGYDARVAIPLGLALGLACVVAAGLLRRSYGVTLGSVLQVWAILLGVVVPVMFVLGGLFAGLWFLTLRLGRRVDEIQRERAAAASPDPEEPGQPA